MTRNARESAAFAVKVVVVSVVEAGAVFGWLWLTLNHHPPGGLAVHGPWWGLAVLAAGETFETFMLISGVDGRVRKRWGPPTPGRADRAHYRRVRTTVALAGIVEIGIWLLWFHTERWLGAWVAAAVLLVLMHAKHAAESKAVCDTRKATTSLAEKSLEVPFAHFLGPIASGFEVAGAVFCLLLLDGGAFEVAGMVAVSEAGAFVFAGVVLTAGFLFEHWILLKALRVEVLSRDIRLPRDPRWPVVELERALRRWLLTHFPRLWRVVQRSKPLERGVNRLAIDGLLGAMYPRPNPFSTMSPYTSWSSLTDRTWTGRHLGAVPLDATTPVTTPEGPPSVEAVAELFRRDGAMRECPRSTVLFAFFAQWITDAFLRTKRKPGKERNTLRNESTNQIDLSQIYGLRPEVTQQLRGEDGLLKYQTINDEEYPPYYAEATMTWFGIRDPDRVAVTSGFDKLLTPLEFDSLAPGTQRTLFASGTDVSNLGIIVFNTLFLREHNRIARRIRLEHRCWKDDQVFQAARATLTVVLLRIIVEDYINHITPSRFKFRFFPGSFERAVWERPNWMAIEFNLLYRWHSLVPPTFRLNGAELPLASTLFDSNVLTSAGLGAVVAAASTQPAGRIGLFNTEPSLVTRAERPSISQARRARLASYNDYRRQCRLPPRVSFEEISSDDRIVRALAAHYRNVEDVEFYVGLFAEDTLPNGVLPELMTAMVAYDAFSQALTNPLLAPQIFNERTLSVAGMETVTETRTIADLVHRNAPLGSKDAFIGFGRRDAKKS